MNAPPTNNETAVVHFRGVTYAPPGVSAPIIDALDLEVRRGETLVLLGESGCGKTTVGRCVLRLVEPTAGEVVFEGTNLGELGTREMQRMRRISRVPSSPRWDWWPARSPPRTTRGSRRTG